MPRRKRKPVSTPSPDGIEYILPLNPELGKKLEDFSKYGVPPIRDYEGTVISNQSLGYLMWVVYENDQLLFQAKNWIVSRKEALRQAVICELIKTEADYVFHLLKIVELFIAALHALQNSGFLLEIQTEHLFTNLPDILAASLSFWDNTFYPMLSECIEKRTPFRVDQMVHGFAYFKELFQPYKKYVDGQNKNLDYLRSLSNNQDFAAFLSWCYSHMDGQKLQLIDIMVKPMQRLTKYPLILQRILDCTENDYERTVLEVMIKNVKSFVMDINRVIRQRDEEEKVHKLANSIETFDVFFREEDMEKCFKLFSHLNLEAPMPNCTPEHSRCLIFEGDLRFRDNTKENDVRVFLLTDMLLICKKISKGGNITYKMIRPKYMVDKMRPYFRFKSNTKDLESLVIVIVDEVGTSYGCFILFESSKEDKNQGQLKSGTLNMFANKLKEAKICYELAFWYTNNPFCDLSEIDLDLSALLDAAADEKMYNITPDEVAIEKDARERVATMLHGIMNRLKPKEKQNDKKFNTFDITHAILAGDLDTIRRIRTSWHRIPVTKNIPKSNLSNESTRAIISDEPHPGPSRIYRPSSAIEYVPVQVPEEEATAMDITENMSDLTVPDPKIKEPVKSEAQQQIPQESTMQLTEDKSELSKTNATRQQTSQRANMQPKKHPFKIIIPLKPIPLDEQSFMEIPMMYSMPSPVRILPNLHRSVPTLSSLIKITNELMNNVQSEKDVYSEQRAQGSERRQSSQRSHSAQRAVATQSDQSAQSNKKTHSVQDLTRSSSPCNQLYQSIQKSMSHQNRSSNRRLYAHRARSTSPCPIRTQQRSNDTFMKSLPDVTIEPATPNYITNSNTQTASEKLYQAHYERLQKSKWFVRQQKQQQQFLSPDDRNIIFQASSPTRTSLTRGKAFSYSAEYPPLNKMGLGRSQTIFPSSPSTRFYSRSGSTSPVPEPSPERRAKSASGGRSNRSGTTPTDTHGEQNTRTSQETEARHGFNIPIITLTPTKDTLPTDDAIPYDAAALTDTMDFSDTAALTDTVAPPVNTSAIIDIPIDTQYVESQAEQTAVKFENMSEYNNQIEGQEMLKDTKDLKEDAEDAQAAEDSNLPRNAEAQEYAESSENVEALENAEACKDPDDIEMSKYFNSSDAVEEDDDVNDSTTTGSCDDAFMTRGSRRNEDDEENEN